ncbi:MAG: bifunctional demethylmenaquinone methyltransferase/2-methoxy-6-polyprenyl-1,4-benzoquinol methylase UbiE [Alphaproteobacteria bacterium]|nr:bifunctional demethylmenaquinone methyltransferase/2-methoxy-6-polyprenyl-1,4-benzoquinol methylase UbiE [Alphaproteobacteria bacterium]
MSEPPPASDETAPFGFRDVPAGEKQRLVGGIFSSVARRYDLMNDVMSLGVHRLWKDAFVDWLAPRPGLTYVDVAGGTGDIAFRIRDRVMRRGAAAIHVVDINAEMLQVGRSRESEAALTHPITWTCGNAERLALPDGFADAYTIAFGIRNVTHLAAALSEAYRVLKPGGRFLCLEFSRCDVPVLDSLYDAWSFHAIPALGARIGGDGEAYRYLVESIRRFPDQETFATLIGEAGFGQVRVRNLTGGIAAMHSAWKI